MPSALGGQAAISFLPAGSMVDFAGTTAPSGWLMCDGAAVSRTVYASLFSALGTAYGSGDGSTTFNLPDYRGRFARYLDDMGTVAGAAGRDTGRAHGSAQAESHKTHVHGIGNHAHQWLFSASGSNTWFTQKTLSNAVSQTTWGEATPTGGASWGAGQGASGSGFVRIDDFGTGRGAHYTQAGLDSSGSLANSATQTDQSGETRPINLSSYRIIKY